MTHNVRAGPATLRLIAALASLLLLAACGPAATGISSPTVTTPTVGGPSPAVTALPTNRHSPQPPATLPTSQPSPPAVSGGLKFDMEGEYQQGKPIEIAIRNNSSMRYYYQSYYPACYNLEFFDGSSEQRPYPYADPVTQERLLSPGQFIVPQGTHCDLISEESLDPGKRAVLFTWEQQRCVKDRWGCVESVPVEPGKYRVRGEFSSVAGVIGSGVDQGTRAEQEQGIITVQWDFIINPIEVATGSVTTPVPTPPGVSAGANENEDEAAAMDYALALGVDMDEARRRADLLEQVRPTLDAIRAEVSDDMLAGLSIEHQPDLQIRLRLTDDPSPVLQSIIDESPVRIIVITDAPLSLSESQQRLERALPGLQKAVPELMGAWIDERTGDRVLDAFIEGDPEQVAQAKSRIEAAADSLAQQTGLPVRIVYLPAPVSH